MDSSFNSPSTKQLYRGTQIVWYILGLVEVLLAFRFVFKLLGTTTNRYTDLEEVLFQIFYSLKKDFRIQKLLRL